MTMLSHQSSRLLVFETNDRARLAPVCWPCLCKLLRFSKPS